MQLIDLFRSIAPMTEEELATISPYITSKNFSKKDYFIREGDIPNKMGLVTKGVFRYYYIDKNGNEFTKAIMPEGDLLISYSAMIEHRPSYFSIEALEDAEVDILQFDRVNAIASHSFSWQKITNVLLTKGFCRKEERERDFLLLDATERYEKFLAQYPGIDDRIKQHIIASYLGITPVALSRIRKKSGRINLG